jgi:hypothetical protein
MEEKLKKGSDELNIAAFFASRSGTHGMKMLCSFFSPSGVGKTFKFLL